MLIFAAIIISRNGPERNGLSRDIISRNGPIVHAHNIPGDMIVGNKMLGKGLGTRLLCCYI